MDMCKYEYLRGCATHGGDRVLNLENRGKKPRKQKEWRNKTARRCVSE